MADVDTTAAPQLRRYPLGSSCRGGHMMRWILVAVMLLIVPESALSDSLVFDVSPQNISSQRLTFEVQNQEHRDETIAVVITVAPGADGVSPEREGSLVFWERDAPSFVEYTRTAETQRSGILIKCSVQERVVEKQLRYEFQVKRDLVPRVSFVFTNSSPGMPSFDVYAFGLGQFILKAK